MGIARNAMIKMMYFLSVLSFGSAYAGNVLYNQNFDSGKLAIDVADPVWKLPFSMGEVLGKGNLFEVVSGVAHSGEYSLRFNYDGKNGLCNTCGGKTRAQKTSLAGVDYFLDSEGINLAADPIKASVGRVVYNKSDGFSKWKITGIKSENGTNDRLQLSLLKPGIGASTNKIGSGDDVVIYRQCDVDGIVAKQIDRRSDCDKAVNYFKGVKQLPGQSIYRRVYLQYSPGTNIPSTQKLRYWKTTDKKIINLKVGVRKTWGGDPVAYITGLETVGSGRGRLNMLGVAVLPGKWYYVEEEFKAETSDGAGDGQYRVWFYEAGKEKNVPVLEFTGLDLKPAKNVSLWGNHQHSVDTHGLWYMDDVALATVRLGPTSSTAVAPPAVPGGVK